VKEHIAKKIKNLSKQIITLSKRKKITQKNMLKILALHSEMKSLCRRYKEYL